jgi:dipeptide/tripeptide permease
MAGLLTTAIATTSGVALIGLCGGLGIFGSSASNVFSSTLDIAPRHADILMSIMNTVGTIPGVISVAVAGYLVDLTSGYAATFVLAAVINVIGASVWAIWGSCEKAFD